MVTVYYSERMQITISEGKRHVWQSSEETIHKFQDVLFQENHMDVLNSPSNNV